MKNYDIIIIGGVAAGMSAASQARRADSKISICVLENTDFVSYAACGMPYYISDKIKESSRLIAITKEDFISKRNIDVITKAYVEKVDFTSKTLQADVNFTKDKFSFNKLIIATGAKSLLPQIDGIHLNRVFMLRNMDDGIAIKDFIQKNFPKSCVIIGGGFIGLEMAESLRELGIECTIVEKMESVAMSMDAELREKISAKLTEYDVHIMTRTGITKITKEENSLAVSLDTGKELHTDFIIASVGVVPNTDIFKGTTLKITEKGAILVNEKSETNIEGVYAAGDCATVKHIITGEDVYMPLGTIANKQGRVAGLQAAGVQSEKFKGVVGTQLVKVFDLEVGKTGLSSTEAARSGIKSEEQSASWKDIAAFCPASELIFVKLIINSDTRQIIGGQVTGKHGAAQRTNIIATAISAKMTIEDFAYLDLGYAPPFAPVWDSVLVAAQKFIKR